MVRIGGAPDTGEKVPTCYDQMAVKKQRRCPSTPAQVPGPAPETCRTGEVSWSPGSRDLGLWKVSLGTRRVEAHHPGRNPMTTPSLPRTHELIRSACSAPSVHNTQPWSWRVPDPSTVELYADPSRQLLATDPRGRNLAISCGAALHHLEVAAEAFGLVADVTLLPLGDDQLLLARIHLSPGRIGRDSVEMLTALENRLSDRRGFTSWDVPPTRLRHLCESAAEWGAHAVPLTDPWPRHRAEDLLEKARRIQAADPRISEEQATWADRLDPESVDGIPTHNAVPAQRAGTIHRATRFDPVPAPSPSTPEASNVASEPLDGLVAICTSRDNVRAWLHAGQAMSAVWLRATLGGLAVTPVSQVIEVDSTRRRLQHDVFAYTGQPQIMLRIGWPEASRPEIPHTPRRSLEDVLRP